MTEYIQVVTTAENKEDVETIAAAVVEKRLAACAQVLGPITSTYWWKDKVETAGEWLCLMKTRADRFEALAEAIGEIHPYEVPEIIALPIVAGSRSYLDWMNKELRSEVN